jgi:ABC-type glycerol-3-phosphate transport system permease component
VPDELSSALLTRPAHDQRLTETTMAGTLFTLPVIVVFASAQRHFLEGLATTARQG